MNGKEALNILGQPGHGIDLIISDVMMPEMDGFTLLKKLKSCPELLQIPVVMLTARADLEDKIHALDYWCRRLYGQTFLDRRIAGPCQ